MDYIINEQDKFLSLFADDMLDLKDPLLREKLTDLANKKVIDSTEEDIESVYSDDEKLFHDKDPMEHFEEKNIQHLMEVNYPMKVKALKVGRNDPCSCGSGKKYKKCCLV